MFFRERLEIMNVRRAVVPVVCLVLAVTAGFSQNSVDPTAMYARAYAIVPMIGSGTWNDPIRPMFAPLPQQTSAGSRTGVIAYNQVQSDNGNFALVEIVAATPQQLALITAQMNTQLSAATGFQLFNRSTTSAATVQSAFQLLKKNFDITQYRVVVP
jgi:hypothetical protein